MSLSLQKNCLLGGLPQHWHELFDGLTSFKVGRRATALTAHPVPDTPRTSRAGFASCILKEALRVIVVASLDRDALACVDIDIHHAKLDRHIYFFLIPT